MTQAHLFGRLPDGSSKEVAVDENGAVLVAGTFSAGAPVGGATEINQDTQITRLESIRDRLPAALINDRQKTEPLGQLGVRRVVACGVASVSTTLTTTTRRVSLLAVGGPFRIEIGTGAQNAYLLQAKVTHAGKRWINTGSNANVWAPGVFGWTEVTT